MQPQQFQGKFTWKPGNDILTPEGQKDLAGDLTPFKDETEAKVALEQGYHQL